MTTFQPRWASLSAVAAPTPVAEPVTIATGLSTGLESIGGSLGLTPPEQRSEQPAEEIADRVLALGFALGPRDVELGLRVDPAVAQRLLEDFADDGQCALGALAPVPHLHGRVVEADPRATHKLAMHQDEPAVTVVLRGAGLARHVGLDAEARADRGARAF